MKDEVIKIIDKLIKKGKASPEAISLLEEIVDKMGESKKESERLEMLSKLDSIIEASKVDNSDVIEAIKQIKLVVPAPQVTVEPPKVEVNVPKQEKPIVNVPPTVLEFPKEMHIKRPSWINGLINLQPVIDVIESVKLFIPKIVFPSEAKEPVSVRLSDGERFYRAIGGSSGSSAIPTYKNSDGEVKQGLVDPDGHMQVDVLTTPETSPLPTGASTEAKQDDIIANQTDGTQTSQVLMKTGNDTFQVPRLDYPTHTLQTIDYAHHEIHAGSHFMYTDCLTLASAGTQDYLITTPNTTKWTHMSFEIEGSAITALDVYEATDKTGTTLQTIFNNDRNSETTSVNTIHKGTSGGTTDGTKIWCHKSGSATNQSISGASSEQNSEIILKQNTKYIFRITSGTADNLVNIALEWYEHTNKTA